MGAEAKREVMDSSRKAGGPGARGHDGHRGGRRCSQRHGHDRPGTPTASDSPSCTSCAGAWARGEKAAEVFLVSASQREESLARLAAMESTDDGFELAAFDLSLRREGDILGNRQHGASGLKLVNIMRDGAVIEAARADAQALLEVDPNLEEPDPSPWLARSASPSPTESAIVGG